MPDKKDTRRKLLKTIAAGSGAVVAGKAIPESWSRPVVDSVVLPAHAATTDDSGSQGGGATTTTPAPTTTPACCLTAGEYCGYTDQQNGTASSYVDIGFFVSIIVAANGNIEASVFDGCNRFAGTEGVGHEQLGKCCLPGIAGTDDHHDTLLADHPLAKRRVRLPRLRHRSPLFPVSPGLLRFERRPGRSSINRSHPIGLPASG